jgi:hypothetical protein
VVPTHTAESVTVSAALLEEIKLQLTRIQFGSLEIQVHNGQVVQLERREKTRWDKSVKTR